MGAGGNFNDRGPHIEQRYFNTDGATVGDNGRLPVWHHTGLLVMAAIDAHVSRLSIGAAGKLEFCADDHGTEQCHSCLSFNDNFTGRRGFAIRGNLSLTELINCIESWRSTPPTIVRI